MPVKKDQQAYMTELGETVRLSRKAAGLTQIELAELAGVGKSSVFDIEKGKTRVQLDTLLNVLRILEINLKIESPLRRRGKNE